MSFGYNLFLTTTQPRKRRKLSEHIPENKYTQGMDDAEVIDLADMQYDYALLSARIQLADLDKSLIPDGGAFNSQLAALEALQMPCSRFYANSFLDCCKTCSGQPLHICNGNRSQSSCRHDRFVCLLNSEVLDTIQSAPRNTVC